MAFTHTNRRRPSSVGALKNGRMLEGDRTCEIRPSNRRKPEQVREKYSNNQFAPTPNVDLPVDTVQVCMNRMVGDSQYFCDRRFVEAVENATNDLLLPVS